MKAAMFEHKVTEEELEDGLDALPRELRTPEAISLVASRLAADKATKALQAELAELKGSGDTARKVVPGHAGGASGSPSWDSAQKIKNVNEMSNEAYEKLVSRK